MTIGEDGSELVNAKIITYLPPENKNEEAGVATMEQPLERRPALNRKRARFSLMPYSGRSVKYTHLFSSNEENALSYQKDVRSDILSVTSLSSEQEPDQNISVQEREYLDSPTSRDNRNDKIFDELLSTNCTDLEGNEASLLQERPIELEKLSLPEPDQNISVQEREYIDLPTSMDNIIHKIFDDLFSTNCTDSEGNEVICLLQKHLQMKPIELEKLSEPDQNISVQERQYIDSPTNMDNRIEILDEVPSTNCTDSEGNEATCLLQEHLPIKPIELEKLSPPELEGIKNINLKFPRGNFTKPRKVLLDIHNLVKWRTPQKENHRLFSHLASPTPSKSPSASLTSLKKRILQTNTFNDQFSAHDIDELPARNLSMFEGSNRQSGPFNNGKQSNASHGQLLTSHDEDAVGSNKNGSNEFIEHFNHYSELSETENSSLKEDVNINVDSSKFHIDIEVHTTESLQKRAIGEKSRNSKVKAVKGKHKEVAPTELNDTLVDSAGEHLSIIQQQLGESSTATVMEDYAMNALENASGQNDEQKEIHESRVTLKKEGKLDMVNKGKKHLRRQSLAAVGPAWESGLRRSNRIKVRPLEFWKGERFLYGRIHQSLATVIGLKYLSPAKGSGQPNLKVKSYVPSKYKDLVEHAALH